MKVKAVITEASDGCLLCICRMQLTQFLLFSEQLHFTHEGIYD